MIKNTALGLFLFLFSIIVLSPFLTFAQTSPASTTPESKITAVTVATVNIYDAKIISQSGNTFAISFDISNRVGVQSGIKYSVTLVKPKTGDVADEHVYSEVLALGENQTITKTITYTAPASVSSGTYQLWLRSNNDRGLPLALANLGNITITSSNTPKVDILGDTCYLTVDGEKSVKKYTLRQGVDIANTESLTATCKVFSTMPISKTTPKIFPFFTPTFETHFRTLYGDIVPQTGGATTSIAISAGTSTISVSLPKAFKPQAYDVLFSLVPNSSAKATVSESNKVNFHYVLRGLSGTVQNTVFDKLSYKKGDIAQLQIFTSESADSFERSRAGSGTKSEKQKLDVTVTDTVGIICGSYSNKETRLDPRGNNIAITMLEDCNGPIAKVTLGAAVDDNSDLQTLDSKSFENPLPLPLAPTPVNIINKYTVIFLVAGLFIVLIVLLKKRFYENK